MGFWTMLQVAALLATFAGIVWGVLRFFVPPAERRWKTTWLSLLALSGFANQLLNTWHAPTVPARAAAAMLLYLASMGLFWSAVSACARPLTAIFERDTPKWVVMDAPYSLIRHPFYAAYSLFWIAGWVGSGAWSTAVVAVTMVTLYVRAARSEEAKFASSPLAETYQRYQRNTGFLVPRLPVLLAGWRRRGTWPRHQEPRLRH